MAGASGNVKAGKAFVEIMLDQTKLERGLKAAQSKLKSFGAGVAAMGTKLFGIATVAAAPLAMSTKTFADFDDEMRTVKAVTGAVDSAFSMLTATAEKLGRETSFTAKQVAEGMTSLGRMGFRADEIDAAIPAVLNLARATGTELGEAAEIAANNMRVFGISVTDMTQVSDLLTATANGSAQTLADLAEGLKMAGPQAAAAGDDIRNVAASLGVLANMGIRGSLAGTALRKAYSQFAKLPVQQKLAQFNISTVDKSGNLRDMPSVMADIARVMNTMPTAERLSFAEDIFDLRGSLAGLQLGGNIRQLEDFIRMLGSVDGKAAQTAEEMDAGIGGSTRRLMSALEGVQIAVGRILGEALAPFMEKISLMLNRLAEWAAAHKEIVITAAKVVGIAAAAGAALVALGIAFKTVAFAVGALNTAFAVMKVAVLAPVAAVKLVIGAYHMLTVAIAVAKAAAVACWAAVSSPAFLIGAALAGVTAVVWKLTGAWDICADAAKGFWSDCTEAFRGIGEVFGRTWEAVKTAIGSGDLAGAAKIGLAGLKLAWLKGILPLEKAWIEFRNLLSDAWTVTVYGILKLGNSLWYGLLTGLDSVGDAIADAWAGIWNGICNVFASTCEWLEKQWMKLATVFDSGEVTDAALRAVERKYADAKNERDQAFAAAVNGRAQSRENLSGEWTRSNSAIDQAMSQEIIENQRKYGALIDDAQAKIGAATAEWRDAMDAVRRNAEAKQAKVDEARGRTAAAAERTQEAARRAGVGAAGGERGMAASWSLRELQGMLGMNDWERRTAAASENSARLQQEANRYLKRIYSRQETSGLSYGG
jgi:TP901 family phage tail tape measure protein